MRNITLLGSTGSIGRQTLDVIRLHPEKFKIFALTAQKRVDQMVADCLEFCPRFAVMRDEKSAEQLHQALKQQGSDTKVLSGEAGLCEVASHPDVEVVMTGIVGGAGLKASMAAASSGKHILLANKESLIMAGELFLSALRESKGSLVPVDSEHNAVFQCWNDTRHANKAAVSRIFLTASGGPFLHYTAEALQRVTPEMAVKHPNWAMGAKISVDSATLANKALEVIEAHYLFDMPFEKLGVLLHPQSIIHAMVEYKDGSVLSHLGEHDMRVPISYALGWPERIVSGVTAQSLLSQSLSLEFNPLNPDQFPCFKWATVSMHEGPAAVIIFNAANEIAVQAFLEKQIPFTGIAHLIEKALTDIPRSAITNLEAVFALDHKTRLFSQEQIMAYPREFQRA